MKKTVHLLLFFAGILFCFQSIAQQEFTLYNMHVVPQRGNYNPSFTPMNVKAYVGIPVFSSEYISLGSSGFRYSDIIKHRSDDSLYVDFNNMLSKLSKKNYISVAYQVDLLSFGFAIKEKNFISFNMTEKAHLRFRYPKNFMEFIWKGNAGMLDNEVKFNFGLNFLHYREYAIGYSRKLTDRFSLGIKLKYLYGMENFSTKKSDVSLITASSDYAVTAKANILINTSGLAKDTVNKFSLSEYAFMRKNNGMGIDLGVVYHLTKKVTLSASILDLGFIKWKNATTNYKSNNPSAHFTYNGFELNQLINSDSSDTKNIGKTLTDSLAKIFKIDTLHETYSTRLSSQIYLGANYNFTEKASAGFILYSQLFDKSIHSGIALSYNHRFLDWLSLSASYSIYNRSYNNIGFGAAFTGGPVQFYIASDNILGIIFPQNTKNLQLHFGLNLLFGRKKATAPAPKAPAAAAPPSK